VTDRVVVNQRFAIRDLVRGLLRISRHVLLLLTEREARLLDSVGDRLASPPQPGFPLVAPEGVTPRTPQAVEAFLHEVDLVLGTHLRSHPAPLVLVGADPVLAAFERISRNTGRLAGTVTGIHPQAPLADLVPRIRLVLERHLLSRQDEALRLVDHRRSRDEVVEGVTAAWSTARTGRLKMLAVEEGLVFLARISEDDDLFSSAEDVDHPGVLHELVALVIRRGGWVTFVADGLLSEHQRVVLTLR
jgi:Bacterial archaeo-eukaryotic release factor family 3